MELVYLVEDEYNLKDFSEKLYFELKEINKISKNFKIK